MLKITDTGLGNKRGFRKGKDAVDMIFAKESYRCKVPGEG